MRNNEVAWHVELEVRSGQLANFLALTARMVEETRNERGVLSYQRFVNDEATIIHVYERYESSDAALAHLQVFKERFAAEFSAMVSRSRFVVYGQPNDELRRVLGGLGATCYLRPFGDFSYWA
jgi:quinol monooxygenase YgiN